MDIYYGYLLRVFIGDLTKFASLQLILYKSTLSCIIQEGKKYGQTQAWSEIMAKGERRTELPLQTGFPPNFCFLLEQSQRCCTFEFGTFGRDSFLHLISL